MPRSALGPAMASIAREEDAVFSLVAQNFLSGSARLTIRASRLPMSTWFSRG